MDISSRYCLYGQETRSGDTIVSGGLLLVGINENGEVVGGGSANDLSVDSGVGSEVVIRAQGVSGAPAQLTNTCLNAGIAIFGDEVNVSNLTGLGPNASAIFSSGATLYQGTGSLYQEGALYLNGGRVENSVLTNENTWTFGSSASLNFDFSGLTAADSACVVSYNNLNKAAGAEAGTAFTINVTSDGTTGDYILFGDASEFSTRTQAITVNGTYCPLGATYVDVVNCRAYSLVLKNESNNVVLSVTTFGGEYCDETGMVDNIVGGNRALGTWDNGFNTTYNTGNNYIGNSSAGILNTILFIDNEGAPDAALTDVIGGAEEANIEGEIDIRLYQGEIGSIMGGAASADYSVGAVDIQIGGGTVTATTSEVCGGGMGNVNGNVTNTVKNNASVTGWFVGGAFANQKSSTISGSVSTTITGGTFGAQVIGGDRVSASSSSTVEGTINGDVNLTITGGEFTGSAADYDICGAGYAVGSDSANVKANVKGSVNLSISNVTLFGGATEAANGHGIFGGGFASGNCNTQTYVEQNVSVTVSNSNVGNVFGGGWSQNSAGTKVAGCIDVSVTDSIAAYVFGGGAHASDAESENCQSLVEGNVTVTVDSSTVKGVYARGMTSDDSVSGTASVTVKGSSIISDVLNGNGTDNKEAGVSLLTLDGSVQIQAMATVRDFDSITIGGTGSGTGTVVLETASVDNANWTFDLTDRTATSDAVLNWSNAEATFTDDVVTLDLSSTNVLTSGALVCTLGSENAFTGTTFKLALDDVTMVENYTLGTAFSSEMGVYSGYSLANVNNEKLVLNAYTVSGAGEYTYDGKDHAITISVAYPSSGAKVYYSIDGKSSWIEGSSFSAKDSGIYNVNFKIEAIGYETTITDEYTLSVTKKELTVNGTEVDDKTYDGNTEATIDTLGTLTGVVTGDDVSIDTASGTFTDKNAGNGKDVTISYTLKGDKASNYTVAGDMTTADITPRDVTLTSASASKMYNGTALTDGNVTESGSGFIAGEGATYTVTGTQTDAGSGANAFTYTLNGGTLAQNYDITMVEGTLTVTPRDVTLTSATDSKPYDGSPLTNDKVKESGSGFVEGEGATYTVTGTQTEIGSSANSFTYTLNGGTLADNYEINTVEGTLTVISPIEYTLSESVNTTYDGNEHGITVTVTNPPAGASVYYSIDGGENWTPTETSAYKLTDATDGAVSVCFKIEANGYGSVTTEARTITINRKTLSVSAAVEDKLYDGTTDATIHAGTLSGVVEGEDVTLKAEGSFDNAHAGSRNVSVSYSLEGEDAANYVTDKTQETVSTAISKRQVTMTSGSAEKFYDGTPLANSTVTVSGDGWADGEGATYHVKGSQTLPGSSDNSFTYVLHENTKLADYDLTKELGTLTVLPPKAAEVTVTGNFTGNGGAFQLMADGTAVIRTTEERTALNGTLENVSNWEIIGSGDFSGSGTDGLLWRDLTTGELVMQYDMTSFDEVNQKTHVLGSVWEGFTAKAAGVFTDNGLAGALIQCPETGDISVSTTRGLACFAREDNGETFTGWLGALVNTWEEGIALKGDLSDPASINANNYRYEVVGVGDFNGDGRDDVMLKNTMPEVVTQDGVDYTITGSGDVFTFLTGDKQSIIEGAAPEVRNTGREIGDWEILDFGDFDGDGTDDVLLSDGTNFAAWKMADGQRQSDFVFSSLAEGDEFAGIADVNNDGTDDILFRTADMEQLTAWTIEDGKVTGTLALK